ncbi:hypothetical protein BN7_4995 [Wickerhamomyces ciferrii]|uniref:Protein PBN1 n=1 Tax=Wickerhamomyces ciferrii (strain ATCC 14091 / BCRC 22168 / CBS 111 / JCM 3599 / NBRC 0793 / NRRL Y-1031 F-60-10) TaxID=1206466 RepID=K0KW90_WICCF|nr:uncharacterized protein BN7_4995 [Wickerhamomyces ciferrii]CCH45413.1 hypothetical protein BN7_4995 [Wickerhamomyces ciferrii]
MKQRITLLSNVIDQDSIDTNGLEFTENSISIPNSIWYQRQDRLTLDPSDISPQLSKLLSNYDQFKFTLKSSNLESSSIFQNFHPNGLTLQLLPKSPYGLNESLDQWGNYLSTNFNPKGSKFNHENFVLTATSLTYHKSSSELELNSTIITQFLETFNNELDIIDQIQDLEISYDSSNPILKIQWISIPSTNSITTINKSQFQKEIAILKPQSQDLEDLELSGLRTILSPINENYLPPTKTLIYLKPRHKFIPSSNTSISLSEPIGLHPVIKFQYIPPSVDQDHCKLYISTLLPSHLFFDKYQFNSNSLQLLGHWGESDLELPLWKIKKFGSLQLFEIKNHTNDLELIYHSRYLDPFTNPIVQFNKPDFFYACDSLILSDPEHVELNPFDDSLLGIDSFFTKDTVFYHLDHDSNQDLQINIPNLSILDYLKTQLITLFIVLIGTGWLLYKIFNTGSSKTNKKAKKINIKKKK